MRKVLMIFFSVLFFILSPLESSAKGYESDGTDGGLVLYSAKATAYCLPGKTCDGTPVREGIAAAKKEWYGKTLIIYQKLPDGTIGKLIGIYEVRDAGGTDAIRNGYVIDIWRPSYEECQEFMNLVYEDGCKGNIYIQVVEADG